MVKMSTFHLTLPLLFGCDDQYIDYDCLEVPVHRLIIDDCLVLKAAAKDAGFNFTIASGYRSYQRQLKIWNDKLKGLRPVFDDQGCELDLNRFSDWQKVQAVLRWSALPGASRHHWGCDIDIYDKAAMPEAYQLQLSAAEVESGGMFGPFHDWLEAYLSSMPEPTFFKPYAKDSGGIAPERWHLSHCQHALSYQRALKIDDLKKFYQAADIMLKETVLEYFDEIYQRFIDVPLERYPKN